MNTSRSLAPSKGSRLRRFASALMAGLSFMLRYNGHTIRFALYMLPTSEHSPDNLREALQSLD